MTEERFDWADTPSVGKSIKNSPHFEYHPAWKGLRGADTLPDLYDKAIKKATQEGNPDG